MEIILNSERTDNGQRKDEVIGGNDNRRVFSAPLGPLEELNKAEAEENCEYEPDHKFEAPGTL